MLPPLLLAIWLIPCAVYDWRGRRIPNWLTLPPLPLAFWWAAGHGTLALTITVFGAGYLAFRSGGMGGADGKLATVIAAISPAALLLSGILLLAAFLANRFLHRPASLPAAP